MTTHWTIHENPKSITINDAQGHILARINRSDVPNAEAIACLMADAPQQKEIINRLMKEIERLKNSVINAATPPNHPAPLHPLTIHKVITEHIDVHSTPNTEEATVGRLYYGAIIYVEGIVIQGENIWAKHTYYGETAYSTIYFEGREYLLKVSHPPTHPTTNTPH